MVLDYNQIWQKQVLDIISKGGVKGIAHITGGGFTDNIPRVFPEGLGAVIFKDSWVVPPIFKWIQKVRHFICIFIYNFVAKVHRHFHRLYGTSFAN